MKDLYLLLDKYIEKHSISANQLEFYLKEGTRNFDIFIKRNKLQGKEDLVKKCIFEKSNKEILTLESFKLLEDFKFNKLSICFYKGVEPATIEYEKFLSDKYDTNLSNISLLDKFRNLFEISDWGINKFKCVIYHKDDLTIIRQNLSDYIYEKLSEMNIEVIDGFEVSLEKIVTKDSLDKYVNEKLTTDKILDIISNSLNFEYKGESDSYYIWDNVS
tara:strand:- start:81 stop:731 length:651 start_codon:yes stop_codon:yes gene_type:complete